MRRVNVLVVAPMLGEDAVEVITEVCPEAEVTRVPYYESVERRQARHAGLAGPPENEDLPDGMLEAMAEAEVIVALVLPHNAVARAPKLRWVQNIGAGIEQYFEDRGSGVWENPIILTNMGGFNSHAIAEYVLGMIIVFSKGIRGYVINQQSHLWQRSRSMMVAGRTVGVIGLGRIGSEVAKLCKGLDMRVLANKRSAGDPPSYVDQLYGPDGLHEMLGESDYVVLALPSIPETIDIIGAAEFRAMKETAVFINIARGVQVVEAEMAEALKNGEIAGAALDVVENEPLDKDSPLWDLDNVIITPHASASVSDYGYQVAKEFAANLRRYIDGEPMRHVVDKEKGY